MRGCQGRLTEPSKGASGLPDGARCGGIRRTAAGVRRASRRAEGSLPGTGAPGLPDGARYRCARPTWQGQVQGRQAHVTEPGAGRSPRGGDGGAALVVWGRGRAARCTGARDSVRERAGGVRCTAAGGRTLAERHAGVRAPGSRGAGVRGIALSKWARRCALAVRPARVGAVRLAPHRGGTARIGRRGGSRAARSVPYGTRLPHRRLVARGAWPTVRTRGRSVWLRGGRASRGRSAPRARCAPEGRRRAPRMVREIGRAHV